MRIPLRSYIIFAGALLIAAFGAGQAWTLTVALQEGNASFGVAAAGTAGAMLLTVSAAVLLRILFLLQNAPALAPDAQKEKDGANE